MTARKAIFVDLDGTLLAGNSMHVFMKCLPRILLSRRCVIPAAASIFSIGLRSLRVISHKSMKWQLTKIARRHLCEKDWKKIAGSLMMMVDPDVISFINVKKNSNYSVYIATAAMEEYAVPLGEMLGIDGVIATKFSIDKSEYLEVRGDEKLRNIQSLVKSANLILCCFLTDHRDDLPTAMEYSAQTLLVHPDADSLDKFKMNGISNVLKTRN